MLKIEKTEVYGWEHAIRGMRNPLNSWDKSDSYYTYIEDGMETAKYEFFVGDADFDLMKRLRKSGTDHRKFMRMITVYADITAPLYWWKEMDTYKVGTVANSCSTMHKIHSKEITIDDFSIDLPPIDILEPVEDGWGALDEWDSWQSLNGIIEDLEELRKKFNETNDRRYWRALIQLLPEGYNQKRTVMLNYEVLANIYKSRCNHKLDEWHTFCEWIEKLPYSELITGKETENE